MQTITGKFIKALPITEGDSQRGHWIRGGFIIEHGDEFIRTVAFTTYGEDRVLMPEGIPQNTMVQVGYQPESREFEGRWYTELRCFTITPLVPTQFR